MDYDPWCHECNGLGTVRCECGGDICVCLENGSMGGEMPCPTCYPGHYDQEEDEEV